MNGTPVHDAVDHDAVTVDHDVVIVGAGPVGLVLAILLGQRNRRVLVLEARPEPYRLPRAVHFDHEVGRILQSCGIGAEVRAVSEPAEVYEWRNGTGTTLLRFGRVGVAASGWPFSSMFCQPALEGALADRVEALPTVDVRRGTRVHDLDLDGDSVLVRHDGGTARAAFVVGCDGANSTVRDLVGIEVDDQGFAYDWLVADVILSEPRVFDPVNLQICDPARPTTAVSGGPGRRRWEFMRLPDETVDELEAEDRVWQLLAPWDVHPANAALERHVVYTFQARVAERWRAGPVFLAGDAAHLMPPFAGQGMCSGLRDAANLAWKLDLVLAGIADDGLLDTYDLERRPNAEAAIAFSVELGAVICIADPDEAAARDAAMAAGVDGSVSEAPPMPGIEAGILHPASPRAGSVAPQAAVEGEWFDDRYGSGWRLVSTDRPGSLAALAAGDPGATAVLAAFDGIGGTVVELGDVDHDLATWLGDDSTWLLQRPDFHVYGTAIDAAGALDLLTDLHARLAPGDRPHEGTHP